MTTSRWPVLRRTSFIAVVGGETLSMVGDSVYLVALTWLILQQESARVLAVSLICLAVPRGLLLLVGGVLTDRFSARSVMFCSHLVRAVLVAALTLSAATGHVPPWQFFAVSGAFGVADAFFWPASKSVLPTLVPAHELVQANAVYSLGEQAAGLAGPVAGGLLVASAGPAPALAVDAATFAVAATTIWTAPRRSGGPAAGGRLTARGSLARIREGMSYARGKPGVRVVLVVVSASALSYSGLFAVVVPGLAHSLEDGPLALGLMISAWGLGQLLGAASAGVTGLPGRWGLLVIGMAFAEAASFAAMALWPSARLVASLFVVLGFGVAYTSDVALAAWIQTTTPQELLGRVNSVLDVPRMVFEPISIMVMGVLVSLDVRAALAAAAVPMLLAALTLSFTRAARQLAGAVG